MLFLADNVFVTFWGWVIQTWHGFSALHTVERWMGTDRGYAVLFGLLLSCGLGVPLPEDIPLLLAGYFVANGQMNLFAAGVTAWAGIIGGDCCLYWLGRLFGTAITKVPVLGSHISQDRLDWTHQRFEEYGVWVVAVGRLFAGIRGAMVLTAGVTRFTFWHFIIADGLAAVFSGGLFIALGYWARKHFGDLAQIDAEIKKSQGLVLACIVVAIVVFLLWKWWQKKRREERKRIAIQKAMHREAASGQG